MEKLKEIVIPVFLYVDQEELITTEPTKPGFHVVTGGSTYYKGEEDLIRLEESPINLFTQVNEDYWQDNEERYKRIELNKALKVDNSPLFDIIDKLLEKIPNA